MLLASSLCLRLTADIVGGTQIGLVGFVFVVPIALILMFVFVRMLVEMRRQCLVIFPSLEGLSKNSRPPSLWLALAISSAIVAASASFWWFRAFPPGALLVQGLPLELRIVEVTRQPVIEGGTRFYSQQVWIQHQRETDTKEAQTATRFPLLAPKWIDEDETLANLRSIAQRYSPGSLAQVWSIDPEHGPFFERRYSARSFAALLWWLCAGFVVMAFVVYCHIKPLLGKKHILQSRWLQKRFSRD